MYRHDGCCLTVVRCILLAADQIFRVEEVSIRSRTNLVDWGRVKVDEDASWNMLAIAGFREECLICSDIDRCIGVCLSIWQETMFQKIQFPG